MATSPSEFLTFYRAALRRSRMLPRPAAPARAITYSAPLRDIGDKKKHTTRKDDRLDVQNEASHAGRESKASETGGHATSETPSNNGPKKAKSEHPEAPDTAIGFQDERGGKGH